METKSIIRYLASQMKKAESNDEYYQKEQEMIDTITKDIKVMVDDMSKDKNVTRTHIIDKVTDFLANINDIILNDNIYFELGTSNNVTDTCFNLYIDLKHLHPKKPSILVEV